MVIAFLGTSNSGFQIYFGNLGSRVDVVGLNLANTSGGLPVSPTTRSVRREVLQSIDSHVTWSETSRSPGMLCSET